MDIHAIPDIAIDMGVNYYEIEQLNRFLSTQYKTSFDYLSIVNDYLQNLNGQEINFGWQNSIPGSLVPVNLETDVIEVTLEGLATKLRHTAIDEKHIDVYIAIFRKLLFYISLVIRTEVLDMMQKMLVEIPLVFNYRVVAQEHNLIYIRYLLDGVEHYSFADWVTRTRRDVPIVGRF